ncbi:MAG: Holliday junction resolvase RuvX [Simkaniaceae bacterium]|nr:Holliday junction resolvase RuvX [Simkaniaceae bacterium]
MGRIVAIDYGRARIGIALTDESQIIASPFKAVKGGKEGVKNVLSALADKGEIEEFVVGLPLHMSGQESEMSKEARAFAEKLKEASSRPVHLFDERLTSSGVDRLMMGGGLNRRERAKKSDELSASLILQTYLSTKR